MSNPQAPIADQSTSPSPLPFKHPPRRASTLPLANDPIYHSPHLTTTTRPPFPPRSAPTDPTAISAHRSAHFHHTSLQARSYLSPPTLPFPIAGRVSSFQRQQAQQQSQATLLCTAKHSSASSITADAASDLESEPCAEEADIAKKLQLQIPSQPSFEPLWEDSDTFGEEKRRGFEEMGRRVGELIDVVGRGVGGGRGDGRKGGRRGGGGGFKIFRNNIRINANPPMCYVEDVYHARCGHWASQPYVYHRCARLSTPTDSNPNGATTSTSNRSCNNQKTSGSREEDSICKRCLAAEREKLQRGTCMSVFSEKGRIKVLRTEEFAKRMEAGKKRNSVEGDLRTPKSPSGFFSWGMQR